MQENNTFRMLMLICAIVVVAILIAILIENIDEIKVLVEKYFFYKIPKY